jgi:glycerophosphoryl diester phosphodiesterase
MPRISRRSIQVDPGQFFAETRIGFYCMGRKRVLPVVHRGALAEAPENTPAAFRRVLGMKVDGIELDVRMTREESRCVVIIRPTRPVPLLRPPRPG